MLAMFYFVLPLLHNILYLFFAWTFYHFACLPILELDIVRISNYDHDKYFRIAACRKSGVPVDARFELKYKNTTQVG